jgi:hypothetical protein
MRAVAIGLILAVASTAAATQITWTGAAQNNQWETVENWNPPQLPGPSDTAIINGGTVITTMPVQVDTLTLGANAELTVDNTVVARVLTLAETGTIIMNSGAAAFTVSGQAIVTGVLTFSSGSISGRWALQTVAFQSTSQKSLKAATVTVAGSASVQGSISFTGASSIQFNGLTAFSDGSMFIAGDKSACSVGFSSTGAALVQGALSVQVPATFTKVSMITMKSSLSLYAATTFKQQVSVPTNAAIAVYGAGSASGTFNGTGTITSAGAGLSLFGPMSFSGSLVAQSGPLTVAGAGAVNLNQFTVLGATVAANVPMTAMSLNVTGGTLGGTSTLTVSTLNAVKTAGITLSSSVVVAALLELSQTAWTVTATGGLLIQSAATSTLAAVQFNGQQPFPATATLVNKGVMRVTGGVTINGANFGGTGSVAVAPAQTIAVTDGGFGAASVQLASGAILSGQNSCVAINTLSAASSQVVSATIGAFSMNCPNNCVNVNAGCSPLPTGTFRFTA